MIHAKPPNLRLDQGGESPYTRGSGAIAQLGERFNGIEEVVGSIPSSSTNKIIYLQEKISAIGSDILPLATN